MAVGVNRTLCAVCFCCFFTPRRLLSILLGNWRTISCESSGKNARPESWKPDNHGETKNSSWASTGNGTCVVSCCSCNGTTLVKKEKEREEWHIHHNHAKGPPWLLFSMVLVVWFEMWWYFDVGSSRSFTAARVGWFRGMILRLQPWGPRWS